MVSWLQSALLRSALKRVLAFALSKALGPLTYADAEVLLEIAQAGAQACRKRGVFCEWGMEGAADEQIVCIPDEWTADDWYDHSQGCAHCPIYKDARKTL